MSEPQIEAPPASFDSADAGRQRKLIIGGGVGVLALAAIGGYLLLSGGSSDSSVALPVPHHVVAAPAASARASAGSPASPSAVAVLPVYHGDVGSRDPFALPAALTAAASPAAAAAAPAAAASAAPAAGASAGPLPGGAMTTTLGGPGTTTLGPGGTTVSMLPGTGTGTGTTPSTVTVDPMADQYLQLLAVHHVGGGWTVDVRSAKGVVKFVKPGTVNVAGTLFYYAGEDETSGKPTFVFELGESKGGNLVPDANESPKHVHADHSTLVQHNGNVDGGVYAE